MPYAREHYIIYAVGEDYSEGKCIEKRFLFFEHKGTRIFGTRKPLIKKKHHILCFLNYHAFLTNKTHVFLDKPSLYGLSHLSMYSFSVSLRASTRNLILRLCNATRCVPTGLIGWDAGSSPARHGWYIALFACPKVYRKKERFFDTLFRCAQRGGERNAEGKKLY